MFIRALLIYIRQLAEDTEVGPGQRIDAPLGTAGYRVDVREKLDPPVGWTTFNLVTSRDPLVVENPADETRIELGPFENRELKAKVTREAEAMLAPGGFFVSNTSTPPITRLARARGRPVLAYLRTGETAAVDFVKGDEGLLMAPAYAVPRMLTKLGLSLQDFDYYEIHEAFAAQVLCTLKAWEDDAFARERLGL